MNTELCAYCKCICVVSLTYRNKRFGKAVETFLTLDTVAVGALLDTMSHHPTNNLRGRYPRGPCGLAPFSKDGVHSLCSHPDQELRPNYCCIFCQRQLHLSCGVPVIGYDNLNDFNIINHNPVVLRCPDHFCIFNNPVPMNDEFWGTKVPAAQAATITNVHILDASPNTHLKAPPVAAAAAAAAISSKSTNKNRRKNQPPSSPPQSPSSQQQLQSPPESPVMTTNTPTITSITTTANSMGIIRPRLVLKEYGDISAKHPRRQNDPCVISPPGNKKSIVWLAFHFKTDTHQAVCNLCEDGSISMLKNTGTSTLARHLQSCHKPVFKALKQLEKSSKWAELLKQQNQNSPSEASKKPTIFDRYLSSKSKSSSKEERRKHARKSSSALLLPEDDEPVSKKQRKPSSLAATAARKQQAEYAVQKAVAWYAVECMVPLSNFDHPAFHALLTAVQDAALAPWASSSSSRMQQIAPSIVCSSESIQATIRQLAEQARTALKQRLQGRKKLVIATDHCWMMTESTISLDMTKQNYVKLTVYWIEDFVLHSAALAVSVYDGVWPVSEFVEQWLALMTEWGLGDAVTFIVADTKAKRKVFEKNKILNETTTKEERDAASSHPSDREHLYCLDHLLQMVAKVAFKAILTTGSSGHSDDGNSESDYESNIDDDQEDDDSFDGDSEPKFALLEKARSLVAYFKGSTQATNMLCEIQKELKREPIVHLIPDLVTNHWWSTLAMVERLMLLQGELELFAARVGKKRMIKLRLNESDWTSLQNFVTVLKPLTMAKLVFEGNKFVTSSLVLYTTYGILASIAQLSEDEAVNGTCRSVAKKMVKKMGCLFESELIVFPFKQIADKGDAGSKNGKVSRALVYAHALDPRFKGLGWFSDTCKEKVWSGILDLMVDQIQPAVTDEVAACPTQRTITVEPKLPASRLSMYERINRMYGSGRDDAEDQSLHRRNQCMAELNAFKAEPILPVSKNDDPLPWWKMHAGRFPTLWKVAQVYLAIPATSASSERAFSVEGIISIQKRCEEIMEDFHLLHENAWLLGMKIRSDIDEPEEPLMI